jgi:crotonobetainyl-CoA:carnitine CoA-transferase CaiB-like acyl-CoA transferase
VTDGIVGHLHNGKRTILMDLCAPQVEGIKRRLFTDADVLVTNFSPAAAVRHGIDAATVRAVNPRLIHCSISSFGLTGPWAGRRAYENQNNAATGMSWRYGAQFGWPLYQPTPITDAATGVLGAFAVAVALYRRLETGTGQSVGASLVQASTLQQGALLASEVGASTAWKPSHGEYGLSALYRLYRASDRSFFLVADPGDIPRLVKVSGAPLSASAAGGWEDPAGALARALESRFATAPADWWASALRDEGIAARPVSTIDEAAAFLEQRDVVYFEPGPRGTHLPRPGISSKWLTGTPPKRGPNPSPIGGQAVDVLKEQGLTSEEITMLGNGGVVSLPGELPAVKLLT